jgi:hypothetical protein
MGRKRRTLTNRAARMGVMFPPAVPIMVASERSGRAWCRWLVGSSMEGAGRWVSGGLWAEQDLGECAEGVRVDSVVGPAAAAFCDDDAGFGEFFQVVADGWLGQA